MPLDCKSNGAGREVDAVNIENKVRAELGEEKTTSYSGLKIPDELLDDTHSSEEQKKEKELSTKPAKNRILN